jgi:tryptophan 7-halogenase
MKKIVILGGGTAGWLTALQVRKLFSKAEITLIESTSIGILGAGEGSVPLLTGFLKSLDIDLGEFKQECDATFKLGINFENWNGDGKSYIHPFIPAPGDSLDFKQLNAQNINSKEGIPNSNNAYYLLNLIANGEDLNEKLPVNNLIVNKKSPYYKQDGQIKKSTEFSFHFNARKLAKYLRGKGEERGIKVIDGEFDKALLNEKDYITGLLLKDGSYFESDFVFDCSGFKRLLIGETYKTEWISYDEHLTVNSAIPFFLPQTEKVIRPETRAIAMKYGWMWQIPVTGRYGCGYIYDDRFIDQAQAKAEVEEMLGHSIESDKVFKFNAGRYKEVWRNNCIAVGLSAGFTEPLEATSLMIAINHLLGLDPTSMFLDNQPTRDLYNKFLEDLNEESMNFIYYHYLSERKDTEFWETYSTRTKMPQKLGKMLDLWKVRPPKDKDIYLIGSIGSFDMYSWYVVGAGVNNLDISLIKKENETLELDQKLKEFKQGLLTRLNTVRENSLNNIQEGYGS